MLRKVDVQGNFRTCSKASDTTPEIGLAGPNLHLAARCLVGAYPPFRQMDGAPGGLI